MSSGLVIVTAENADVALVNRLLLYIRDWEFSGDSLEDADRFRVICDARELAGLGQDGADVLSRPPIQELPENEFEGLSVAEVERTMVANDTEDNGKTSLFLLLDDQGVEEQTIIVAHRAYDYSAKGEGLNYLDEFDKVRVPWESTYSMWCNLDIANMDFSDFCEEDDEEETEDGGAARRWWTYQDMMGEGYYEPFKAQAEDAIKELARLDFA